VSSDVSCIDTVILQGFAEVQVARFVLIGTLIVKSYYCEHKKSLHRIHTVVSIL
jgi:hypothetical protein